MQTASRQCMWNPGDLGTVVEVEMTPETGLDFQLCYMMTENSPSRIDWGDGDVMERIWGGGDQFARHAYRAFGKYRIRVFGARSLGLRFLDGQAQYPYDAAVVSVVDYCGQIVGSQSGAFKRAVNLERFIAPNCQGMGQRDFAYCSRLREVEIGNSGCCYDGTYQDCSALEKYTTKGTGVCWSYVWQGCTNLAELRLGEVVQFATDDFRNTPKLMDIWIDGKTVEQIRQTAPSGNIVSGYGARFPWSANANCRFHGTNGIVLGNGTIIHD